MLHRRLGTRGLSVSALGLGCMGISEFYGTPASEGEAIQLMHRALDLGVSLLDTADIYGPFTNERLVGRAIRGRRDAVTVATKFGIEREADGTFLGFNSRPEYVHRACDASLQRLGVDHIDLFIQHRVDPNVSIAETVGAMADLVDAGKVLYLGLSEAGPKTLRRAHQEHPISVLQTELSLWSREAEEEILPLVRELGVGFVAYSPLGRGFLTGDIRAVDDLEPQDHRRHSPRFRDEHLEKNLKLVDEVSRLAAERRLTPSQLALAWVLAQGDDIVAIPGTKKLRYLEENVAAAELALSPADLAAIDEVMPPGVASGARYDARGMRAVNQ